MTAGTFPAGLGCVASSVEHMNGCECAGIWLLVRVTVSVPAACPIANPAPWCTGRRPRRSGRPKVVFPSPPYVVPIRVYSASYSLIGISWPLHIAQPTGAKFQPPILISPMYGLVTGRLLVLRREDAGERDAEVQHQVRLHVVVRLAAAGAADS